MAEEPILVAVRARPLLSRYVNYTLNLRIFPSFLSAFVLRQATSCALNGHFTFRAAERPLCTLCIYLTRWLIYAFFLLCSFRELELKQSCILEMGERRTSLTDPATGTVRDFAFDSQFWYVLSSYSK